MPLDRLAAIEQHQLLRRLPSAERERLAALVDYQHLTHKDVLLRSHQPITHVTFPLDAMISMLTVFDDGTMVEAGVVGNEGVVGLPVYFGADSMTTACLCQVPGDALVMPAELFRDAVGRPGPLREAVGRYALAFFSQVAQTAACNRLHTLEERLARWLLMTHDRVGRDTFAITHAFLGQMLGVRRARVTVAAGILSQAGLITYRRGRITVLDRDNLEAAACECYRIVREEYVRLIG